MYSSSLTWAIILLLISHIAAYYIDADCDADITGKLTTQIDEAFRRIGLTAYELKKINYGDPAQNTYFDKTAMLLIHKVDYESVAESLSNLYIYASRPRGRAPILGSSDYLAMALSHDHIIFYCTSSRLPPTAEKMRDGIRTHYDPITKASMNSINYNNCFMPGIKKLAMVTTSYKQHPTITSMIQFCPWYLDAVHQPTVGECYDLTQALIDRPRSDLTADLTAADIAFDFPSSIVNELTRTIIAGRARGTVYGWRNCVALKNYQNAASLAFLTAMARQIIDCGLEPNHIDPLSGVMGHILLWTEPTDPFIKRALGQNGTAARSNPPRLGV